MIISRHFVTTIWCMILLSNQCLLSSPGKTIFIDVLIVHFRTLKADIVNTVLIVFDCFYCLVTLLAAILIVYVNICPLNTAIKVLSIFRLFFFFLFSFFFFYNKPLLVSVKPEMQNTIVHLVTHNISFNKYTCYFYFASLRFVFGFQKQNNLFFLYLYNFVIAFC